LINGRNIMCVIELLEYQHEWVVYSTALKEGWLMLQCVDCGMCGTVEDPSAEEWRAAFQAPSDPYRWRDDARVVWKEVCPARVIRFVEGIECECHARGSRRGYERIPGGIWEHTDVLSLEEKRELAGIAGLAETADLCSRIFPYFLRCSEEDTGARHTKATHAIASRIEQWDAKGMHFRPPLVAKILREYAAFSSALAPWRHASGDPGTSV
jgi:hypothetical protein